MNSSWSCSWSLFHVFGDRVICNIRFKLIWDWVTHICINNLGNHWFRWWLFAHLAPSHYLNQWWHIINWTIGLNCQWNLDQNSPVFIHKNVSENVVCIIAAIFSQPHCGNWPDCTNNNLGITDISKWYSENYLPTCKEYQLTAFSLVLHIYIYIHQWLGPTLVQIMACHQVGAKPLFKPMLEYC